MSEPRIGVLAVQGDFAAHRQMLERVGVAATEVRSAAELDAVDGLILPGGESTTMLRFFRREGFIEPLQRFAERGGAFFGTCAGAILLAKEVENPVQESLGVMDVRIRRNAYGRQLDSFIDSISVAALGHEPLEAVFIRAPTFERVGPDVQVLGECRSQPVLVRQGKHLAATFHPELTADERVHRYFVEMLESRR